jgi:hypothetical protein
MSLVRLITTAIITTIAGTTATDRSGKKTARDALPTGGRATAAPLQLSFDVRLVVQNDIQQGTVDFNTVTVVMNEAQFSKFVHEETYTGPGRPDHLSKRLLADFRDDGLRFSFLAKVRQQ